ncbi:hypothetical protein P691DRAFT_802215 [Macrolepiota fuliginosa MF-IS2]|uniref:Uncharacterized protein n=1 Tax=Macrolepiota fuliginosa MF-IS2 TaxID=1400762 RepID=A0A9P6C0N0_9AGAR|nr:hypothetical protein P691DRAFT_802215 [Macrolepiota fuliginosa MF-IS2]
MHRYLGSTAMSICGGRSPFDFRDSCARASWGALVPGTFVCVFSIPVPGPIHYLFEPVTPQFWSCLSLQDAKALDPQVLSADSVFDDEDTPAAAPHAPQLVSWRTVVFTFIGTVEILWWLAHT